MTRVACCGEHTTHSGHPAFLPEYPARVAASLGAAGKEYAVSNFGFPTAVVTEAVSRPAEAGGGKARLYSETEPARLCAAWRPDVVVLGPFGKHDALGPFSTHDTYDAAPLFDKEDFKKGLRALVRWATTTAGASRVLLALPIPYPFGSTEHTTTTVVLPATVEVAAELSLQTIDLHSTFAGRKAAFTDADHLQDHDISLLAELVAQAISLSTQTARL